MHMIAEHFDVLDDVLFRLIGLTEEATVTAEVDAYIVNRIRQVLSVLMLHRGAAQRVPPLTRFLRAGARGSP